MTTEEYQAPHLIEIGCVAGTTFKSGGSDRSSHSADPKAGKAPKPKPTPKPKKKKG